MSWLNTCIVIVSRFLPNIKVVGGIFLTWDQIFFSYAILPRLPLLLQTGYLPHSPALLPPTRALKVTPTHSYHVIIFLMNCYIAIHALVQSHRPPLIAQVYADAHAHAMYRPNPCLSYVWLTTLRRRQNGRHFQTTFSIAYSWIKIMNFD